MASSLKSQENSQEDCDPDATSVSSLLPSSSRECKVPGRFFFLRARIVSVLVPFLFLSTGEIRDATQSQYLMKRMAEEDGFHINGTELSSCFSNNSDPRIKESNSVQERVSQINIYCSLLLSGPAFFTCLLIGSYADYLGRRVILLLPLFAGTVRMVITTLFIKLDLDYWFLYMAYAIDGVSGSWFVVLLALFSLTSDINHYQQDRSFWIYFMGCPSAVLAAATSVANGYVIDFLGYFWASTVLTSLTFLSFLVPLVFLPETLLIRPAEKVWNPLVHLRKISGFYFFDGSVRKRLTFCLCMALFFFGVMSDLNLKSIDTLYQMHEPFCWNPSQIGIYKAIQVVCSKIPGLFVFKLLQKCITDEKLGVVGNLCQAVTLVYEAFIQVDWQFYLVPVLLIPGTFVSPIIRSMMSMLAAPAKQGALFSSIAVVETICNMVSLSAFNKVYMSTVSFFPGAVYIVIAACSFLTFLLFLAYFCVREKESTTVEVVVEPTGSTQRLEGE